MFKNKLLRYAYPVAALMFAAALVLFFKTKPAAPPHIAADKLRPERDEAEFWIAQNKSFGLASGLKTRTDSLAEALEQYRNDQYPVAEQSLRQYLQIYPADSLAQFYLGLSLLYQEEYEAAQNYLSPLADLESFNLRDDARWYSALASTNTDRSAALGVFQQISRDLGSQYREPAAAVLASAQLSTGSPTFRVQRQPKGSSMVLVMQQPWWQNPWARAFLLFLPASAVGLIFWRKRLLRQERAGVERVVALRTQEIRQQKEHLEKEKERSEEILLNILPRETAEELKKYGHSDARRYEMVTVLFCDFKEFTRISEELSPEDLVASLDQCFEAYDRIVTAEGLEKIKTVGDCYICAGGLTKRTGDEAVRVVRTAQAMLAFLQKFNAGQAAAGLPAFEARIGIHTGTVVAGIVGIKKYSYDIWGDTVNTAARMEQNSEGGRINISGPTYELVRAHFSCTYRGKVDAKGKGAVDMYFVE